MDCLGQRLFLQQRRLKLDSAEFSFFFLHLPGGFKERSIFNNVKIGQAEQCFKNLKTFFFYKDPLLGSSSFSHFQVPEMNASENQSFRFRFSPLNEMCPVVTAQSLLCRM